MKALLIPAWLLITSATFAQTKIDRIVPVQKGQTVSINFDYPELVRVSTWDKNEISIQGSVSINAGENDDAFTLKVNSSGKTIAITNDFKDFKDLPKRITVYKGDEKIIFKNRAEYERYAEKNGRAHNRMSEGIDMDIFIEIKIPKQMETTVELVYGVLEVKDFVGPLNAKSTYGAVDVSLKENSLGEVSAETNYGKIYTNLSTKFENASGKFEDFHTYVSAKLGTGPRCSFVSTYGNVYLRKEN